MMADPEIESRRAASGQAEPRRSSEEPSELRGFSEEPSELAQLATLIDRADAEASRLRARRFELWVEARRAGLSWRDIAKLSGVDHAMVAKVVAKQGEPG